MYISNYTNITIIIITTIAWVFGIYKRNKFFLNLMKSKDYNNDEYLKWIKKFHNRVYNKRFIIPLLSLIMITTIFVLFSLFVSRVSNIIILMFGLLSVVLILLSIKNTEKIMNNEVELKSKDRRLFLSTCIVNSLEIIIVIILYILTVGINIYYYPIILLAGTIIYLESPYNIMLGNILKSPIENRINRSYYEKAYEKIRNFENLKTIGITGSFGKSTTKFITEKILEKSFSVLKTTQKFNTTRNTSDIIINDLDENKDIFLVEMNAKKTGDIEKTAKLSNPKIGVITDIGPTHLDTFNSMENIMKTKYELIEELPADGVAIFNYDNKHIKKLADKTFKEKILFGIENTEEVDIYATEIEVNKEGSTFIIADKEGNQVKCSTKLVGNHNISNILASVSIGKALGMSLSEMAPRINEMTIVPYSLKIASNDDEIIFIEDGFKSNPLGAKSALDVIKEFDEGRKIIVTSGLQELGTEEKKENEIFGKNISKLCDYVILIENDKTKYIYDALLDNAYSKENIKVEKNIQEAKKELSKLLKPKDVVLIESDINLE